MWTFIIIFEPLIQIVLSGFNRVIELFLKAGPEKFIQQCSIKEFCKRSGPRVARFGGVMLNVVKVQKDFIHMHHGTPEVCGAVIGRYSLNGQLVLVVKRQYPLIENINSGLGPLAGI